MLRLDAVRSILFDQVAGLPAGAGDEPRSALLKARRRAILVAAVDWAAILALFLLRDLETPFLVPGPTQQGIFTLGVLAVATHAGFRLGQLEKYSAVSRAIGQLPDAAGDPASTEADG